MSFGRGCACTRALHVRVIEHLACAGVPGPMPALEGRYTCCSEHSPSGNAQAQRDPTAATKRAHAFLHFEGI